MADEFTLKMTGTRRLTKHMEALTKANKLDPRVIRAQQRFLREVGAVSQTLVPRETGALADSMKIEPPSVRSGVTEGAITYGGGPVDYALIVHEDLEAFHDNGQAKYLEIPFLAGRDGYLAQLKKEISEFVTDAGRGGEAE